MGQKQSRKDVSEINTKLTSKDYIHEKLTTKSKLKQFDRDEFTVHGYTKTIQQMLPINNQYYNIPNEIIDIILLYFHIGFTFNKEYHSPNIIFIDDKTIKFSNDSLKARNQTAIFGEEVNSSQCNKYTIFIKWDLLTQPLKNQLNHGKM